jgi:protein-tyrosine phosphatase
VDRELGERGGGRPSASRDDGSQSADPDEKGASQMTKVLFVCMGNICRSPTAQGVFRKMVADAGLESCVVIESVGTHAYHVGEPPDARAQQAAKRRGYEIGDLQARQITQEDFRNFDLILAMDWENLALLQQQCPRAHKHKLHLLMRFAGEHDAATVPDPYYGGPEGFNTVLDYVEDACQGLIEVVRKRATMYAAA